MSSPEGKFIKPPMVAAMEVYAEKKALVMLTELYEELEYDPMNWGLLREKIGVFLGRGK